MSTTPNAVPAEPPIAAVPVRRAPARGNTALAWWREHCHPESGDPAARARLRRCRDNTQALAVPAAVRLVQRLGALPRADRTHDARTEAALGLARVLAHVVEHTEQSPMRAAGWPHFPSGRADEERPRLAEPRFRRLLQAAPGEEQVTAFVRLVALLGGVANVAELADAFLWWNDRTKQRWTFDYYAAALAAPTPRPAPDEDDDA